jgi:hypothetical protein
MSRDIRSKRNCHSRRAQEHRRRRVLELGTGAFAVLVFGLGPWGVAPLAHADEDEFDLILEPITNSLSSIDPTLGADVGAVAQVLEQDWGAGNFGTELDNAINGAAERVDPSLVAGSCGLICDGADGTPGGALAAADGQSGGVWFGDGGSGGTDAAGNGGHGGEFGSTSQLALVGQAERLVGQAGQLGLGQLGKLANTGVGQAGRRR